MKPSKAFLTFVEQVAFTCGRYAFYNNNGGDPAGVESLRHYMQDIFGFTPTARQMHKGLRFLVSKGLVTREYWRIERRGTFVIKEITNYFQGSGKAMYQATPKLIKATSGYAEWRKAVAA